MNLDQILLSSVDGACTAALLVSRWAWRRWALLQGCCSRAFWNPWATFIRESRFKVLLFGRIIAPNLLTTIILHVDFNSQNQSQSFMIGDCIDASHWRLLFQSKRWYVAFISLVERRGMRNGKTKIQWEQPFPNHACCVLSSLPLLNWQHAIESFLPELVSAFLRYAPRLIHPM